MKTITNLVSKAVMISFVLFGVAPLISLVLFGALPSLPGIQSEASWIALDLSLGVIFFVSYIAIALCSNSKYSVRSSYKKIFA